MAADVAPGARDGLQVVARLAADGEPPQALQPGRHELGGVLGQDGEQRGQVLPVFGQRTVPVAGHVGLAEPDQAGGAEPAVELPGPAQHHDRGVRSPAADDLAAGEPDP